MGLIDEWLLRTKFSEDKLKDEIITFLLFELFSLGLMLIYIALSF